MQNYSFLMSVYKKEKVEYLKLSIDSMLEQTIMPEQIVIVEDGELTESLSALLDEYKNKYSDVFTLVKYKENKGLGKALDIGMNYCRNDLIARMDSDDISLKNRCERQLKLFEDDNTLSIVSGNIAEFKENVENIVSIRTVPEYQDKIKKRMRTRSAFNHPAVMYKKSEVQRCGGYGDLKRKQDHDLFSRMMNNGCKAYNIQDIILYFRADDNNHKRRKSWINCKSYIIAQWNIFKRHECNIGELIYVVMAQCFFKIAPLKLIEIVTHKFLRKEI